MTNDAYDPTQHKRTSDGLNPAERSGASLERVVSLIADIQSWADSEMEKEWCKPREMRDTDRMRVLSNTLFHLSMAKGHLKDSDEANDQAQRPPGGERGAHKNL